MTLRGFKCLTYNDEVYILGTDVLRYFSLKKWENKSALNNERYPPKFSGEKAKLALELCQGVLTESEEDFRRIIKGYIDKERNETV